MAQTWGAYNNSANAPNYQVDAGMGVSANGLTMYANTLVSAFVTNQQDGIFAVNTAQTSNTLVEAGSAGAAHTGWHLRRAYTGGLSGVSILTKGQGINANGFLVLTGANGSGINIAFTFGDTSNAANAFSGNAFLNGVVSLAVTNVGSGYTDAGSLSAKVSNAANITQPTFTFTLGGKAGRITYECLVAMNNVA